ncbi:MAG: FKBP-type peptidyl-prolyl cis-trans isomerase [Phenylobacterium sp.]
MIPLRKAAKALVRAAVPAVMGMAAGLAVAAQPTTPAGVEVSLPGISYQVLASGPAAGAHPTRADTVSMRYVGRLSDGEVFSTSPGDGRDTSVFAVKEVIPGMSAALQLMRPGDHWRITMPPYLAYGPGRPIGTAPPSAAAAAQVVQKHGIPPDATLVFDVELVAIMPPAKP